MKFISILILLISFLLVSCRKKDIEEPEKTINRKFNSFIFVGAINGNPGLYKYKTADGSVTKFWSSEEEEVVELSYSDNHSSAFFLTAAKTGKEGIFPFIKSAKLYVIPDSSSIPVFVSDLGSGIQVFSRWESGIVFRIVINTWDKSVSTFINQNTIILNTYGKVLQEENQIYDITKDGYPRLPANKPEVNSPAGKYRLAFNSEKPDSVFLIRTKDKSKFFVTTIDKPVNDIGWSDSRKFIFITTLDVTSSNGSIYTKEPNTSSLYIYSVDNKRLVKEITGAGFKNFFTINDFLIFDDGFGKNSSIYIYNFKENKIINKIKIKDGCGLNDIPKTPQPGT